MKKIFTLCTILAVAAILMTACNRNPGATDKVLSYEDTVGLSQFQNWKMQNERLAADQYYQQAVQRTSTPAKTTTVRKTPNYGSGSMNSGSQNQAKTTAKKGWSKGAKGAVIGGGVGAAAGAVINKKNRVVGGAIGAVLGAGIGY